MTQSAPGFLLHLRLFLEGIEVPVISAGVTATIGSGATATIDIIPDDTLDQILPRTAVHLFYLDSFAFKASGEVSPSNKYYKLLFAGEVFSVSSSKAGMGSRTVSLNCLDFSNVLDTNYIYQFKPTREDSPDNPIIRNTSRFLTTLDSQFDSIINSPSEVIRQLSSASPSWEGSTVQTSLLGGLFSIIERLLGVQGLYYGTNGWITIQERRTRFLESIISDTGETAAKVYNASQFSGWLTGRLAQEGQVISFRRLVDIICEFIFYSMVPNPVAKYVKGESSKFPGLPNRDIPARPPPALTGSGDAAGFAKFSGSTGGKHITGLQPAFRDAVLSLLDKVHAHLQAGHLLSGRKAKVHINRGYVESNDPTLQSRHFLGLAIDIRFEYDEKDGVEPNIGDVLLPNKYAKRDRLIKITGDSWYTRLYNAVADLRRPIPTLVELEAAIINNPIVYNAGELGTLKQDIAIAMDWVTFGSFLRQAAIGTNLRVLPTFRRPGLTDPIFETILGLGNDPVHIQFADDATTDAAIADEEELVEPASKNTPRERLHSFVFRPDVWFVVPPKSNIIFPDMLQSFNTQREMMRETTRLQLDVGLDLAADSGINQTTFFAPQIKGQESLDALRINDASKLLIYDHEKYSGVIPKFERMLDTVFFIEKAPATPPGTETGQAPYLSEFAPKVAHFHLLSERYRARSASVALTFSPHIICGFPAAVLDAIITADELASKDISLSRSFKLGLVESVSHSISQGGAQTQVRLTHVRSHRSGDKTDDLFANTVTNIGSVELTVQDPTLSGLASEIDGTFGCEAEKTLNQLAESEYGFKAIAALLKFSSIEELIQGAISEPDPSDVINLLEDYPFEGDGFNADASLVPRVVTFSATSYKSRTIKTGQWQGNPTLVFLFITTSQPGADSNASSTNVRVSTVGPEVPFRFEPPIADLTFNSSFKLVAFSVSDGLQIIPLLLPGSKFVADLGNGVSETGKVNPVEESIRPIWISNDYSVQNITEKIYQPFFGTSAITSDIQAKKFILPSVEEAVDHLAKLYAREVVQVDNRQAGADFPAPLHWIYEYSYRPVATYADILGSKTYDPREERDVGPVKINDEKFKYFGGFHSNAVTSGLKEYGKELAFLDIKGAGLQHQGASAGNPNPFTLEGADGDRLDPRADRAQRVLSYKSAIKGASAIGYGPTSQNGIAKRG